MWDCERNCVWLGIKDGTEKEERKEESSKKEKDKHSERKLGAVRELLAAKSPSGSCHSCRIPGTQLQLQPPQFPSETQ